MIFMYLNVLNVPYAFNLKNIKSTALLQKKSHFRLFFF